MEIGRMDRDRPKNGIKTHLCLSNPPRAIRWFGQGLVLFLTLFVVCAAHAQQESGAVDGPNKKIEALDVNDNLIRFNFKGATFDQVLDYFSRATGMPVVKESSVPDGTIDYLSPVSYSLPEALQVLNILLQSRGVMLRVENDILYLQALKEMARENIPTFISELTDDVTDDQIVTLVLPLKIALAKPIAEKLGTMVAAYGSIQPLEQQNALLITETAAQVRRLIQIIRELDREDPEGVIEIIPVKHGKASDLLQPLKALLSEKVIKYVINQDGKQVKIEEDSLPGLKITIDKRTNTLIAKGMRQRLDKLKEALELLDVPVVDGRRSVKTIQLSEIMPAIAKARLDQLFSSWPAADRPVILTLDEQSKIVLAGQDAAIAEAIMLLTAIDSQVDESDSTNSMTIVPVKHISTQAATTSLNQLLNPRQKSRAKIVVGADGQSLILAGPETDLQAIAAMIELIDKPSIDALVVRLVKITSDDPLAVVDAAQSLFDRSMIAGESSSQLEVTLDERTRTLTLIGDSSSVEGFIETLEMIQKHGGLPVETRQIILLETKPSEVIGPLRALLSPLLKSNNGQLGKPIEIEAVDQLDLLVVTADPSQFELIDALIERLDQVAADDVDFMAIALGDVSDPIGLVDRAEVLFALASTGMNSRDAELPDIEIDTTTGQLLVSGWVESVARFAKAIEQARQLQPPPRDGRMISLTQAKASDVQKQLLEILAQAKPAENSRQIAVPEIQVIDSNNSLYVVAESKQHEMINALISELDNFEHLSLPPMKLLQVRAADAAQIAGMLQGRYDTRPSEMRREQPVEISSDTATNTLIVSAHPDVFGEIKSFVDEVNATGEDESERTTIILPLQQARATDVAIALNKLYPNPPIPLDRRGKPMPHLRPMKEVHISADAATNTLIIEAPSDRRASFESLVEKLDLQKTIEVRTYPVEHADIDAMAQSLSKLADAGALSPTGQDRRVPVSITADPATRTLVISGPAEIYKTVERVLGELDLPPSTIETSMRLFSIKHARPAVIAETLQAVVPDRIKQSVSGSSLDLASMFTVISEPESSTVIVSAPVSVMPIVQALIQQLDQEESAQASIEVRLFKLEKARAEDVARAIARAVAVRASQPNHVAEPPPVVTPEPASNVLVVAATADQMAFLESLIVPLDSAEDPDELLVKTVFLKYAQAERIAPLVEQLLAGEIIPLNVRMEALRRRWTLPEDNPGIRVVADKRLNAIVLSGASIAMPLAEELVAQLDVSPTANGNNPKRPVHVLVVDNADANSLAENIRILFEDDASDVEPPTIRVDVPNNCLLIRATDLQYETITQVVNEIDQAALETARQVRTISIDPNRAEATAVADLLKRMMNQNRDNQVEVMTLEQLLEQSNRNRPTTDAPSSQLQRPIVPGMTAIVLLALAQVGDDDLSDTNSDGTKEAEFRAPLSIAVDEESNSLVVVGSPRAVERLGRMAKQLVAEMPAEGSRVRAITLPEGRNSASLANLLRGTLYRLTPAGGKPGDLSRRVMVMDDPQTNTLIITSTDTDFGVVGDLIVALTNPPALEKVAIKVYPLTMISSSQARASLEQLIEPNVTGRSRNAQQTRAMAVKFIRDEQTIEGVLDPSLVKIREDPSGNALVVIAPLETLSFLDQFIAIIDETPVKRRESLQIFELKHAKANEATVTLQQIFQTRQRRGDSEGKPPVDFAIDSRTNTILVTASPEQLIEIESILAQVDVPTPPQQLRVIHRYEVSSTSPTLVADVIREVFGVTEWSRRWWDDSASDEMVIRVDQPGQSLIIAATESDHAKVEELIDSIDSTTQSESQHIDVIPVEFAQARDLAGTLDRFFRTRARANGSNISPVTIAASDSTNCLIVSGDEAGRSMIKDLMKTLDQPDASGQRSVEIIQLGDGQALAIANIIREQFSRRSGSSVVVTPDLRTNTLILNAPKQELDRVKELVAELDAPSASDETVIRTYELVTARADEVVSLLTETLQLDGTGRTRGITVAIDNTELPSVEVKAKIVADQRSNSLIVTATSQSFPIIEHLIKELDAVPTVNPIEYRVIPVENAIARELAYTLNSFSRSLPSQDRPRVDYDERENQLIVAANAQQFEQISKIVSELDTPSEQNRTTEFVPLQFAQAMQVQDALSVFYGDYALEADTPEKRSVRIVADPATNSLVISAAAGEWEGIRALLLELDSEQYDASLQLKVIALRYADATSVAKAINDAFQASLGAQQARESGRSGSDGDDGRPSIPKVLVEADEWVRASAEPQTNSVIVSASRQNVRKVQDIIEQLDVADHALLPPPRIIPLNHGDPVQVARAVEKLFGQDKQREGADSLRIVGDPVTNTILVRAEDDEFEKIKEFVNSLESNAQTGGVRVQIVTMNNAPASRVAAVLEQAYEAQALQARQPLSIQVDVPGNTLIISSTPELFEEISNTALELDKLAPNRGQAIFFIDLKYMNPESAVEMIDKLGLEDPVDENVSNRIVTEPVKAVVVEGRRAIMVVANPLDKEAILGLLKALDSESEIAAAELILVPLVRAEARAVAAILAEVLSPSPQQAKTPLAEALEEQIRRLNMQGDDVNKLEMALDLTVPIRVIPDTVGNALLVGSNKPNLEAMRCLIKLLDRLPVTEAVTVKVLPLENIAAEQFARIMNELFSKGSDLASIPGSNIIGQPSGIVGKALMDQVAISVDQRTNTVIVAGKEDVVATVEVLSKRLDQEVPTGWVESRMVPLRYADAVDLAQTIESVLVQGTSNLPQAGPLQEQVGRLRLARIDEHGGQVLESDIFQPMTKLVIEPQPQLNALILVSTPSNLEVITELVHLLDVEAASPSSTVRIYPIKHASAAKLGATLTNLFDQQAESKAIRSEDRVIMQADDRTNALIVTTSTRSFAVLENLMKSLDTEISPDLREIRIVNLENSSASRLANLIQQLMDARLDRLRMVEPETADLERATVVADPRTNALIIAAGNESFDVIQKLAIEMDQSQFDDGALVQILPIKKGNAARIATTIETIMQRRYTDLPAELQATQKPMILTDSRSNSILVTANPEDSAIVKDLVTKLESAPVNQAVTLHVLALPESRRCEQLAPRLQSLMRERQKSLGEAGSASDRVSIQAEPSTNALIIASSEENMVVIENLLGALINVEGESGDFEVEVLTLHHSRASDLVPVLEDLYVEESNRARGNKSLRVTADDQLNAVLVSGPERDLLAIRGLVAKLDGARPEAVVEIKYISLTSANALETVNLIENVLSGRGIGSRRGSQQSIILKYLSEMDDGEVVDRAGEIQVSTALRESISLTPDLRTNTIIVSAPQESMLLIERMITDLDESNIGAKSIRIFKLVNADATAMAEMMRDLFQLRHGKDFMVLKPRDGMQADIEMVADAPAVEMIGTTGLGETELTAVPDLRQQLSITVDSRTNSLLVSGSPTYLDLVEEVIEELDSLEANERETLVYQLRNATAEEVARVLGDFADEEQRKLVQTLNNDQLGSAARLLEREITIRGDAKSNTVLISASPRYMGRVRDIIEQLDVDPPQVLIHVLLAEVSLKDRNDWGVELSNNASIRGVGVDSMFALASASFSAMTGTPTLSIASSDFGLIIKALEAQNRVHVLSNPSVMAANNVPAIIDVGEEIYIPDATQISEFASITSVIPKRTGVILNVTPSINPDGYVRMEVEPRFIQETEQSTTPLPGAGPIPIFRERTAGTTVTVRDGETIILGGLIQEGYQFIEEQVPILGSIPIIGALFRSETKRLDRTELLIVLTPHVIHSPAEIDRFRNLRDGELNKLTMPNRVIDDMRDGTIDEGGSLFESLGDGPLKLREWKIQKRPDVLPNEEVGDVEVVEEVVEGE